MGILKNFTLAALGVCVGMTAAAPASASAAWHLHTTVYTVQAEETLTDVAKRYVNTNTPLRIYREGLKELNYDLLKDRADQDVRPGDVLTINFWTQTADK